MCGIVALIQRNGVDEDLLTRLTAGLSHRGPDGQGIKMFDRNRVAFGHRRLSILDLSSAGTQPMSDVAGEVWITYNGEIFNYLELQQEVRNEGYPIRTGTDTEVLLALYKREGIQMLRRLRGMYAFLLHDTRTNTTYYARDPVGIKPLYSRCLSDGIAFASEPTVLRQLGSNSLDVLPIVRSLMYLYPPGESFGIREIRRVPPGEVGCISPNGKIRRLPVGQILPDGRGPGRADLHPTLDELNRDLRQAVRESLTSDVPVGVAFSGGLDSSLVAKIASLESTRPIRLYSFLSPLGSWSDRIDDPRFVKMAAERLGLHLSTIEMPKDFLAQVDSTVGCIGEPIADPAAIAFLNIAKKAREEGCLVILSGHGADELFAGYRRHWVAHSLMSSLTIAGATRLVGRFLGEDMQRLSEIFREPKHYWLSLLPSAIRPCGLEKLLARDVLSWPVDQLLEPILGVMSKSEGASSLRRLMHLDFCTYLPDQNLDYLDKVSMAHGIEARFPFLTPPLLSLAAVFQDKDLIDGKEGKAVLRRLAARVFPQEIGRLPKRGFGIPLRYLISREWQMIRGRLTDKSLRSRHLWNPNILRQIEVANKPTLSPLTTYSMLVIDQWFREWKIS